jgi:acetyl-CoA acetyltransferase
MTPLGKFPNRSVKELARAAVDEALSDAGLARVDIQAAWFSNTRQGLLEGQNTIRGQCALRSMGFSGIPIVNVENACASSTTAVHQARAYLAAGLADVGLVVGAEKMFFPEKKEAMLQGFLGGTDVYLFKETRQRLAALGAAAPAPVQGEEADRSFFMDIYAALARQHMAAFGSTVRQIAAAAAKNHAHSQHNPLAQYRSAMTIDEVLADKPIVWPLTRAMCAPISDGAAAVVLATEPALRRFGAGRAVRIRAAILVSSGERDPGDFDRHAGRIAALAAYEQSGVGSEDVDIAEVHDATAFAEILQSENLGLCARGEGGICAERGETTLGGRIPINTSGGLVSKGHPIAATGAGMLYEIVTQLRGEADERQVEGARIGLVENGGGFGGVEEAATTVTVLEAPA